MYSINYWKGRANWSGAGSRGALLDFKTNFVNNFIKDNEVSSVLDFGCGDMHFAKQLSVDEYVGVDIVDRAIPSDVASKNFKLVVKRFDEVQEDREFDLCMAIDVLYHIVRGEEDYLESLLDNMILHSSKYLLIYAQDSDQNILGESEHVYNCPWKKLMRERNVELIYEQESPEPGSAAKFYAFKVN